MEDKEAVKISTWEAAGAWCLELRALEEPARQLGILTWLFAKSLTHTAPLWGEDSTYFVELL